MNTSAIESKEELTRDRFLFMYDLHKEKYKYEDAYEFGQDWYSLKEKELTSLAFSAKHLTEELLELSDQWGCDSCEEIEDKYEGDIDTHIDAILKKYNRTYTSIEKDFASNGDYFKCYIFSFVDTHGKLHLVTVSIYDC